MEAAGSSETLVPVNHTVRHHIPEDGDLHSYCREKFTARVRGTRRFLRCCGVPRYDGIFGTIKVRAKVGVKLEMKKY
jgi:hypothetical protein